MSKKSFGIIGNPVSHSLSPVLHNYWFNKYNIEATYSLFNIQEQEIETIVKKIKDKELSGVNVTLPYKQKIIPLVDQLVNDAKSTDITANVYKSKNEQSNEPEYEECLSCQ